MRKLKAYSTNRVLSISEFVNKNAITQEDIQTILVDEITLTYILYYWSND